MAESNLWAWIDLETTGLNERAAGATILEIAMVFTDHAFFTRSRDHIVLRYDGNGFLDDFARQTHTDNGLLAECARSVWEVRDAEVILLHALAQHAEYGTAPMCGASIHFDRRWLRAFMPRFHDYFYYGNLDVSSIQKLVEAVRPGLEKWPDPEGHRALPDVTDEIRQAEFYADMFRQSIGPRFWHQVG